MHLWMSSAKWRPSCLGGGPSKLFWAYSTEYNDIITSAMASQITSHTTVCSTVHSGADLRKHQSSASLALCGEFTGDRWIPHTGEFPTQRASNAENVSIGWRHHEKSLGGRPPDGSFVLTSMSLHTYYIRGYPTSQWKKMASFFSNRTPALTSLLYVILIDSTNKSSLHKFVTWRQYGFVIA